MDSTLVMAEHVIARFGALLSSHVNEFHFSLSNQIIN